MSILDRCSGFDSTSWSIPPNAALSFRPIFPKSKTGAGNSMGSGHHNHVGGELEDERAVSDDNFVVETEPFSLLRDKQMNVNTTFTRNLSRKGSTRVGDSIPIVNQRVTVTSLRGDNTVGKVALVAADDSIAPPLHHMITISTDPISNTAAAVESKLQVKKFSFRNQISIDPRRIFLFLATMSSIGTMLLIYFTLSSVSELDGSATTDDNLLS